jgi:DNA-binding MarR family transcriptional regulator
MSDYLEKQHSSVDLKIVALLERLSTALRALLQETATAEKLTPIQVEVLIYLHKHSAQDISIGELVDQFQVTQPTMSDVVRVLSEKSLIEMQVSSNDARIKLLSSTTAGKQTTKKLLRHNAKLISAVESISEDDRMLLFEKLLQVAHALRSHSLITVDKMCLTCRFFVVSQEASQPHYCNLLNTPLERGQIRIDCPEHEPKKLSS